MAPTDWTLWQQHSPRDQVLADPTGGGFAVSRGARWYGLLRSASLEHVSEYRAAVPDIWPEQVQPPGAHDWEQSAAKWLFDQAPGEWRNYHVLRRNPIMLARDVRYLLQGHIQARRDGYARARSDIATYMTATPGRRGNGYLDAADIPDIPYTTLDEYLKVHAQEAERLKELLAQVQVVEDALTGVRWIPRKADADWSKL